MKLAALEKLFTANLRNPDEAVCPELIAELEVDRMQVYRGNVLGAQLLSLETLFPVIQRILGEAFFGQMMRSYALKHPMRGTQLDDATAFPGWLFTHIQENPALADFSYLPDLARLELGEHQAWYAENTPAFNFDAFARASEQHKPENLILQLAPSATLLRSPWPVDRLWQAQRQTNPPEVNAEESDTYLLILRRGFEVIQQRLTNRQYGLLRAIEQYASIAALSTGHDAAEIPKMLEIGAIGSFFVDKAD